MNRLQTAALTVTALLAFAANSLLARAALDATAIDPIAFTAVRIVAGALLLLVWVRGRIERPGGRGSWPSALALFGYALLFSLAYRELTAATGALLLFGAVQITMLLVALLRGESLGGRQWAGLLLAFAGLLALLWPGLAAPSPLAAGFMLFAGVAWGVYTLRGRGAGDPTRVTASNFARASVPALVLLGVFASIVEWDPLGVVLAALSGALASGAGYAIWYAALRHLATHTAAVAQLSVPVLTAAGGVVLLAEPVSTRLIAAGLMVLGGIALVVEGRARVAPGRAR